MQTKHGFDIINIDVMVSRATASLNSGRNMKIKKLYNDLLQDFHHGKPQTGNRSQNIVFLFSRITPVKESADVCMFNLHEENVLEKSKLKLLE